MAGGRGEEREEGEGRRGKEIEERKQKAEGIEEEGMGDEDMGGEEREGSNHQIQ